MGALFGLLVLVLVVAGLYFRRRQRKEWVAEERYEESGDWLDKRSGERGTYGSLDAEREQERKVIADQGRSTELARLLRDYFFENYPGFADLSDPQIKDFTRQARDVAAQFLGTAQFLAEGQMPELPAGISEADKHVTALKKIMLDYAYRFYPALLDLEIERIRQFDGTAEDAAGKLVEAMAGM